MLNPPETSTGTNGSTCGQNDVTRYRINPNTKSLTAETFPNVMSADDKLKRYVDKFDFPIINEAYRGKEVNRNEKFNNIYLCVSVQI